MTLDYNVTKVPSPRQKKGETDALLIEFSKSGKPCAKVNLFGKNANSTRATFVRHIKALRLNVSCVISGGDVYLVRGAYK